MLPDELRSILPPPAVLEILESHQLAVEFRQELRYREEHAAYCQWYAEVAAQHRQELMRMRRDPNLLGWFRGLWG